MLVVKRDQGLIRKKKLLTFLKKNKRLSRLTINLPLCQKNAFSLLVKSFIESDAIIITHG